MKDRKGMWAAAVNDGARKKQGTKIQSDREPHMSNLTRRVAICILAVLMLGPATFVLCQSSNASIDGEVTDPNGAVVAGATVDLTSKDTNVSSHFVSDANGLYSFRNVVPGIYQLKVKAPG